MRFIALIFGTVFLWILVGQPLWAMLHHHEGVLLWADIWQDAYYRHRLEWTILQAALTTFIALVLSLPIAWTLARYRFRGRALTLRLLMLPFMMPTLVAAMGVLALFGARGMLWRGWQDTPYLLLYGNIFFNLPVAVKAVYQGLRSVPANRIRAAQTLGANAWQCFWHIEMPVLRPWLAGGACLVFLYCFSGFGLALLLGGAAYGTVEVEIYQLIAYELDMARAGVLVWLVLAITTLAGVMYAHISHRVCASASQHALPLIVAQGKARWGLWSAIGVLMIFCALPLIAIFIKMGSAWGSWRILFDSETLLALGNTLRFSLCAVVLSIILGVAHAAAARHFRIMRALLFLPLMVSPVCLAFGILLRYPQWIAELPMLITLYALLAYPFVSKDILAAWDSLPPRYLQAAQILGATRLQAALSVQIPLLLPALRRGTVFATAACIGEFAASLFLSRPEWITLTTLIYQHLGRVGATNHDKALLLTLCLTVLSIAIFMGVDTRETDGHCG